MTGIGHVPIQAETLSYLGSADAHCGTTPQRIDTHLSHVFLAPEYVLKLKRAVKLDFVDYGSIEKRRLYCEREIAANAGWASDLYLGVEPVWRREKDWGWGGAPDGALIVDWVVHMRRFDVSARGDRLLATGKLDGSCLETFADELASRHAQTRPSSDHGYASDLQKLIEQISDDLAGAIDNRDLEETVAEWAGSARKTLRSNAALANQRQAEGRVKRCHGDLHLKNLVLWHGRLIGFDALEFDPALTHIDTLYDAAFPAMDMMRHGRLDLANRFLNRFLAMSDDYAGLRLLPLFLSLRAGVRALASVMSDDAKEADAYLKLAARCLQDTEPAQLIAIGGRSGTGKSTLTRALAPKLGHLFGAIVLRSDLLRKRLAGVTPDVPLPESRYTQQERASIYTALCERAISVTGSGAVCILDASFLTEDGRSRLKSLETACGGVVSKIWLDAPPEVLRDRLARRGADASDADLSVLEQQLSMSTPDESWVRVDVSGSRDAALANLIAVLEPHLRTAKSPTL